MLNPSQTRKITKNRRFEIYIHGTKEDMATDEEDVIIEFSPNEYKTLIFVTK